MPVVIDQVIISVEVGNQATGGAKQAPPAIEEKQLIVAECVEQVLEILADEKER